MLLLIPKNDYSRRELNIFDVDNQINILPSFIHNVYFKEGGMHDFAVCEDRDGFLYKVEIKSVYDTLAIKVKEVDSIYDKRENHFQVVEVKNKDISKLHTKPVIEDIRVNDSLYANRMECVFKHVIIKLSQQDDFLNELKFLNDNSIYSDASGTTIMKGGYNGHFLDIDNLIELLEKKKCVDINIGSMRFYFNNRCGKRLFKKIEDMGKKYNIGKLDTHYFRKTKAVRLNRKELTVIEQLVAKVTNSNR